MQPTASIIIVNWNGRSHLNDCLDSLVAQSYKNFEVILVDNGSKDDSIPFVKEHFPWVKLLPLQHNSGFASGNNHGYAQAKGKYIVTLNNDTRVAEDWLEILVKTAESNPNAGMVGCRICNFFDPDLIDSLGMGICDDGMSRGMYRNRRWSELDLPETMDILFPSACAALYRREMLEQIGFFDDDFFAYAEDSDLGLRGRLAGWSAVLATGAVVYHKYSQSSASLSPLKVYLVERNHYWVAVKNFPPDMLLTLPFHTLLRFFEQAKTVFSSTGTGAEFRSGSAQGKILSSVLTALFASLVRLPKVIGKRRQLMWHRRLSWGEFSNLLGRYRIGFKELLDAAPTHSTTNRQR